MIFDNEIIWVALDAVTKMLALLYQFAPALRTRTQVAEPPQNLRRNLVQRVNLVRQSSA